MSPRSTAVAMFLLASVLGCSRGEPDDLFFMFGKVTDVQGAVLPETEVMLSRTESIGCSDGIRPNIFDPPGAIHRDFRTGTTTETGEYLFEMMRFELETPGIFGTRCFRVRHQGQNGAFSLLQTYGAPTDMRVPDLPVWDIQAPSVTSSASGLQAQLSPLPWDPTPPGPPVFGENGEPQDFYGYYYDWVLTKDGEMVWHERGVGEPVELTPELREDFGATLALDAMTVINQQGTPGPWGQPPMFFKGIVRSGSSGPLPMGRVPVSRGASCAFRGTALAGCPLTDGLLDLNILKPIPGPDGLPTPVIPDRISITLPAPVQPTLLVARDLHTFYGASEMLVEGSEDGVAWQELGRLTSEGRPPQFFGYYESFLGTGQHLRIPLDGNGRNIRHLRLVAEGDGHFFALRELSVFD